MGAGQFLLPYLGAQPRSLLNRIVASGAAGMNRRDADDWALSRLIELGYVEESPVDDTAFVCTPAGRHRWQMEILADEERDAIVLRRQLIRQRVDERFSRLGINRSTALTTAYSPTEPRLWSSPPQTKMRWSSVLATVFAAAAAALLVISTNAQPREVLDWPFQPTLHAAVVRADQPKANVEQTALVAAPAAASVAVPVDLLVKEAPGRAAVSADVAPASTQRAASIYQTQQDASVPNGTLAQVEGSGREGSAVVDAASPDGRAIVNSAVTAVALIDAAVSETDQIGTDLVTGVERRFRATAAALINSAMSESGQIATECTAGVERRIRSIAAVLLHAIAAMGRAVSAQDAVTQQVRNDAPTPVAPGTEPPSEREQPAMLQPANASLVGTESAQAGVVHATPGGRVTSKGPVANVDPQNAVVEQLNKLSLAAARRGEAWRPNRLGTDRPL